MDEEANSWLRRTKFSHTVYHRWDSLRLNPVPFVVEPPPRNYGLKSRPQSASSAQKPNPDISKIQRNFIANKQRSLSPLPESNLSEVFKEAKSASKRFSTPTPRLRERTREFKNKLFNKDPQDSKSSTSKTSSNTSPLKLLASAKGGEKSKFRKDSSWTKYFDSGGGKVTAVETADDWSVDLSKLFVGLRFAHGAHSRLYHGKYNDEPVAVKLIRVPEDDDSGALASRLEKQFTREVTLLSRLHHPNVLKFVAACRNPPVYCVITEYLSQGSLRAYLLKLERQSLPLQKLIEFSLDVARGMEYIHSQGIIHRDLKPENVLIDEDFHLKIADFGIACPEAFFDPLADDPGTYRWMAPEMIKHKPYGRKVDVYSFGLMLWEMVSGAIPYEDMTPIQAAFAVVNKNLRPVISSDCPLAMRALIEQCWSVQPDKRPDFWQIVKVLEQFEASVARDGTLSLTGNPRSSFQDHKKGLLHWIQKLGPGPLHPETSSSSPVPKPKFS
ncbi:serine/threonine-protein kinase HT1-like [Cucurbita moschata]|uniref:Serine/threonine-protein kinase HT1-like n=1 Tax=Cucurbita moschata TaxID=3662 RepID=A0A6J1EGH1_CUCMO|nr:serine/threonine-protein kinase HT1-like [Cucurbita moschata]